MNDHNECRWMHDFVNYTKKIYGEGFIPLHRPVFNGNEKKYLNECIDSNFVSSVGTMVVDFEKLIANYVGAKFAIATVNGTAALHIALQLSGVIPGDEVITQALTFVGTCNAISYLGARPVFVDVGLDTLGLCPRSLKKFLRDNAVIDGGAARNKITGNRITACVPMHTFGNPCSIQEISNICEEWRLALVEDAAESLGSFFADKHTGNFGLFGTLSFNGNKIITTGGGGMIVTNNEALARHAKHITTTSKIPHEYEFVHDEIGYNYRLPNLNAALGCAQMEQLSQMLEKKQLVAKLYDEFFNGTKVKMVMPTAESKSNNWLNAIILNNKIQRDEFLKLTNDNGVMTRPVWRLMSELEMFKSCQRDSLENSLWLEERVVNIPSSVPG